MNYQAICRVCTDENSRMVSIFESCNFLVNNCEIYKVITDCASVQIQMYDGLSEQICLRCLDHLYQAYSFKKLCEDSDYKLRNDLFANDKFVIKDEFTEEDTKILFLEMDNNFTGDISESSNVCDFRLTKVTSEQQEIDNENKSEYNESGIKKEELDSTSIFNDVVESVAYEDPYDLKILQYIQEQYNVEIKTNSKSNMEHIEAEEADDSIPCSAAFISEENKRPSSITNLYPEKYRSSESSTLPHKSVLGSKSVTTKRTSALHMKVHTRQEHICNICSNEFVRSTDLSHHMKKHSGKKPDNLKSLNSLQCDISNEAFTQNYASMKQIADIKPEICHKNQKDHVQLPTEEKQYKCNICGKKFKTKGILKTHIKIHSEQKKYKCNICKKQFSTKGNLKTHVDNMHTEEKQYMCNICRRKFRTKGNLKSHIKSHMGEKPCDCDDCDK